MSEESLSSPSYELKEGVIAVLDLMGYRAQSRSNEADVLHRLTLLRAKVRECISITTAVISEFPTTDDRITKLKKFQPEVNYISDTFLITASDQDVKRETLVHAVSELAVKVTYEAAKLGFATRGCIHYGKFIIDNDMVAGSGIYDALSHAEITKEAIIIYTPKAADIMESCWYHYAEKRCRHAVDVELFDDYDQARNVLWEILIDKLEVFELDTKIGRTLIPVLNPFSSSVQSTDWDNYLKCMIESMKGPSYEVYDKRVKTETLLDALRKSAQERMERCNRVCDLNVAIRSAFQRRELEQKLPAEAFEAFDKFLNEFDRS